MIAIVPKSGQQGNANREVMVIQGMLIQRFTGNFNMIWILKVSRMERILCSLATDAKRKASVARLYTYYVYLPRALIRLQQLQYADIIAVCVMYYYIQARKSKPLRIVWLHYPPTLRRYCAWQGLINLGSGQSRRRRDQGQGYTIRLIHPTLFLVQPQTSHPFSFFLQIGRASCRERV